ncbi:type I DNA topoisomerase [soil metagenome]
MAKARTTKRVKPIPAAPESEGAGAAVAKTKVKAKAPAKKKPARAGPVGAAPFEGGAEAEIIDRTIRAFVPGNGKQLVIVESPAKAKTINKYLGPDYKVMASIGHVRDLPTKNPKGTKRPVPGVDLEHDFAPTYVVMDAKGKVISELKRTARTASQIWFATDPDREGEAIAWHLAEELGVRPELAKRVMFNAITKTEIQRAFEHPHPINMDRVNAQQARRILDRIVGYQVSPLLWKKVARGLSAGRVQSVAVRLIVEREQEIRAFMPDEYYEVTAVFTPTPKEAAALARQWTQQQSVTAPDGAAITQKALAAWLIEHGSFRGDLVEIGGAKFELKHEGGGTAPAAEVGKKLAERAREIAASAGLINISLREREDAKGKGPAKAVRLIIGEVDPSVPYRVASIETKRTTTRPTAPFITSTLQQAGVTRLGMSGKHTMAAAQQLYQGVEIPGEGPVALITYMRTDSTHISGEALTMVRDHIGSTYGAKYLPEKPNFYSSSNKDAQEAHEAIRPTSMAYPPGKLRSVLKPDVFKVYSLIWDRFVACQMTSAQWDATTVEITGGRDAQRELTFRANGRVLIFDGFYKATGIPASAEEQTLPRLEAKQAVGLVGLDPRQKFTQPPARYSEASLIKILESEGIGRPSTYASIISVIQERKYAELLERRFYATDLGEAVTGKLIEAFPDLLDVGYTREMEGKLDKVEEDHLDWVQMLHEFYDPFKKRLLSVESTLKHAKAETVPAPYLCPTCGAPTVYRLGKNGKFLSCSRYPDCNYASPVNREGVPTPPSNTGVACPKCGRPMTKRVGKFGPFLGCSGYGDKANPCDGILRMDKKGFVIAPSQPPFKPDPALPCPKCGAEMNLRPGKYGPWLGCSKFPKCRGRGDYKNLTEKEKDGLLKSLEKHQAENPIPIIRMLDGTPLTGPDGKALPNAPRPEGEDEGKSLEMIADEM